MALKHSEVLTRVLTAIPLIWALASDSFNFEKFFPAGKMGVLNFPNWQIVGLLNNLWILLVGLTVLCIAWFSPPVCYCTVKKKPNGTPRILSGVTFYHIFKFIRYIFYLASFHSHHFANYSMTTWHKLSYLQSLITISSLHFQPPATVHPSLSLLTAPLVFFQPLTTNWPKGRIPRAWKWKLQASGGWLWNSINSATFCWSKQTTGPFQIQGVGDRDSPLNGKSCKLPW